MNISWCKTGYLILCPNYVFSFIDTFQIFIEDQNIRNLNLKAYRAQIGCVQQETTIFEGTITENIRLGKLNATQEEIEEAAKDANIHEFISRLPEGYNTLITGDSVGMSRGQRRQIAIARALIRKPKLLLLDEATSALDTRSELAVREAIDRGSKGRTVVFATHRLADVRNADLIIMLERGRIKESGTHQQLLELDGLYAAMLRSQVMDLQQELHLSQ
ncbi:ATP-binding cassette permease MDL2 [Fasciolopsis buskii]|uniref:ATP-binding cassette permease MDL2 n=1 Tax=Fasciolopsis buskii TaxID=27845 RepID=A0A8E0VH23_9TREM|nr:ATP-binding cassette permease MDL2 [Fasciolopsis buski]